MLTKLNIGACAILCSFIAEPNLTIPNHFALNVQMFPGLKAERETAFKVFILDINKVMHF